MHTLAKYGSTYLEVQDCKYKNIHVFYNQHEGTHLDTILANTITGFSNYIREIKPDLIVVHGDRVEPLAAAFVGASNNILVAHIEGGEVSGTIDEGIRHAITKLSHVHFVANDEARQRVMGMGENESSIFPIGSPDIDLMLSPNLPTLKEAKEKYEIPFNEYGILSYHPVVSELESLKMNMDRLISACWESNKNMIVIYPNNDPGSDIILHGYESIKNLKQFRIFPSIRFEFFLTFLKNAKFIVGNSSAGIREAEVYGIPSINIGSRQRGRTAGNSVWHVSDDKAKILEALTNIEDKPTIPTANSYGLGNSCVKFYEILKGDYVWRIPTQKSWKNIGQ